jgi:hypothetical protein
VHAAARVNSNPRPFGDEAGPEHMIDRQHVWVGPEATSFEVSCEACLARRGGFSDSPPSTFSADRALIEGTLRRDADVGFTTCRRGHRIVVRRVGRPGFAPHAA